MSVTYTDPAQVDGMARAATAPTYGRTASGYGPKIPTACELRYAGRWRRVYVAQYGNAGSAYVVAGGTNVYLDSDTEHALSALIAGDVVRREYAGRSYGPGPLLPGEAYVARDRAGELIATGETPHAAAMGAARKRESRRPAHELARSMTYPDSVGRFALAYVRELAQISAPYPYPDHYAAALALPAPVVRADELPPAAVRLYGSPVGEILLSRRQHGVAGQPELIAWRVADGSLIVVGAANGQNAWDVARELGLAPRMTFGGWLTGVFRVTIGADQ